MKYAKGGVIMPQFKVGDLVRVADGGQHYSTYAEWVEKNAPDALQEWETGRHYTVHNLEGRVVVAAPHGGLSGSNDTLYLVRATDGSLFLIGEDGLGLVERSHRNAKIIITTDGRTTLARLYDGKTVIKSAEAKCAPSDEFDFKVGAKLAFDRLMSKPEPEYYSGKVVCVESDGGFTVGKLYEFDNGKVKDDDGAMRPLSRYRVKTLEDWNTSKRRSRLARFIEFKG